MTREELKAHCLKQVESCEMWAKCKGEEPHNGLRAAKWRNDKIRAEMFEEMLFHSGTGVEVIQAYADGLKKGLDIFDKYNGKSEEDNGNNNH